MTNLKDSQKTSFIKINVLKFAFVTLEIGFVRNLRAFCSSVADSKLYVTQRTLQTGLSVCAYKKFYHPDPKRELTRFRSSYTESSLTAESKNFTSLLFLQKSTLITHILCLKNVGKTGLDCTGWKIVFSFHSGMSVICKGTMNVSQKQMTTSMSPGIFCCRMSSVSTMAAFH
jgi:hypothetical protein